MRTITLTSEMYETIVADTMIVNNITKALSKQKYIEKYSELLDIVNDDGDIIGVAPRGLAHRLGLRHQVVFAAFYNESNELLLQTRSSGRLDMSVGGHVQSGETSLPLALAREIKEELGLILSVDKLEFMHVYNRDAPLSNKKILERNKERRFIYNVVLTKELIDLLNREFKNRDTPEEVSSFNWFDKKSVQEAIDKKIVADGLASSFKYLF